MYKNKLIIVHQGKYLIDWHRVTLSEQVTSDLFVLLSGTRVTTTEQIQCMKLLFSSTANEATMGLPSRTPFSAT